jgi:putative FmdB family regulatory protein
MPLYEFHCTECDRDFELLVSSSRWKGKTACPHCGSKKLNKALSVFTSGPAGAAASDVPVGACGMKSKRHGGGCGCC